MKVVTSFRNAHDQVVIHRPSAMHVQDLCWDLRSGEGISSHKDSRVNNEDKAVQSQHSRSSRAQEKPL